MKRSIDADLEVHMDDGIVVVHSSILTVASDVFRSMLSSGLREETDWKIRLPGKQKYTFYIFYRMLHTETSSHLEDLGTTTQIDIAELAHEYQTKTLLTKTLNAIVDNVDSVSIVSVYMLLRRVLPEGHSMLSDFNDKVASIQCLSQFFLSDEAFNAMESWMPKFLGEQLQRLMVRAFAIGSTLILPFHSLFWRGRKEGCKAVWLHVIDYAARNLLPLCDSEKTISVNARYLEHVYCCATKLNWKDALNDFENASRNGLILQ